MEILGIVWAASIITPSPLVASAADMVGRRTQQPQSIAVEEMASWFSSLVDAYGWSASVVEAESAFTHYALSTSWLVPDLGTIESHENGLDAANAPFTALVPVIGPRLMDLATPLVTASASEQDVGILVANEWDSWAAVASVQLESSDEQPSPQTEKSFPFDPVCLRDASAPYQGSPIAMKSAPKTQIWVHDHFIGDVASQVTGTKIARKLRSLIQADRLEPSQIHPLIGANFVGIGHRNDVLFIVDETMRSHPEVPATAIAIQWINNLRQAFDVAPLGLADIQMAVEGLTETSETLYGTASWYGPGFHGKKTANGEIFDQNALTAAHKTLPFNTHLKVTNRLNGKSVVVRINDRGPYIGKRSLDLSKAAAHCLGSTNNGVIPYEAVILSPIEKPELEDLTTAQLSLE